MLKRHELSHPNSCLSKAANDEMVFTLLARDVVAPSVIRFWVSERLRVGKNTVGDEQIREALECAKVMERQRYEMIEDRKKKAEEDYKEANP